MELLIHRLLPIVLLFQVDASAALNLRDKVVTAVNCGGKEVLGAHGISYSADYLDDGVASDAGRDYAFSNAYVDDIDIYKTERWSKESFQYEVPANDGEYVIILKFSEVYFEKSGENVFSVLINSITAIKDLDIFQESGGLGFAYDVYVPVVIKNKKITIIRNSKEYIGKIILEFAKGTHDNPKVNGFVLLRGTIDELPPPPKKQIINELPEEPEFCEKENGEKMYSATTSSKDLNEKCETAESRKIGKAPSPSDSPDDPFIPLDVNMEKMLRAQIEAEMAVELAEYKKRDEESRKKCKQLEAELERKVLEAEESHKKSKLLFEYMMMAEKATSDRIEMEKIMRAKIESETDSELEKREEESDKGKNKESGGKVIRKSSHKQEHRPGKEDRLAMLEHRLAILEQKSQQEEDHRPIVPKEEASWKAYLRFLGVSAAVLVTLNHFYQCRKIHTTAVEQKAAQKAAKDFQKVLEKILTLQEEAMKKAETVAQTGEGQPEIDPNDPDALGMTTALKQLMGSLSIVANAGDRKEFLPGLDMLRSPNPPMEPFMSMIMQTLASKEVMYPPLKEIFDNYPKYLEDHGASLDAETKERYEKQYEMLQKFCHVALQTAATKPSNQQAEPEQGFNGETTLRKKEL